LACTKIIVLILGDDNMVTRFLADITGIPGSIMLGLHFGTLLAGVHIQAHCEDEPGKGNKVKGWSSLLCFTLMSLQQKRLIFFTFTI